MLLSYIKPHWPYIAPAPYNSMYGSEDVQDPIRSEGELDDPNPLMKHFMGRIAGRTFSRDGGHVVVSLFESQLTQRAPWLYNGLYTVSNTVGAALILYILVLLAYDAWEFEETSIVTEFPMVWLIGFLAILTLLCLVVSFRVFLRGNKGHGMVD